MQIRVGLLLTMSYIVYHVIFVDLPMPKLGGIKEKVKLEKSTDSSSPATFTYTYQDLQKLDTITVQLVPEKKGMVFKYQEYFVESKVTTGDHNIRVHGNMVAVCITYYWLLTLTSIICPTQKIWKK